MDVHIQDLLNLLNSPIGNLGARFLNIGAQCPCTLKPTYIGNLSSIDYSHQTTDRSSLDVRHSGYIGSYTCELCVGIEILERRERNVRAFDAIGSNHVELQEYMQLKPANIKMGIV